MQVSAGRPTETDVPRRPRTRRNCNRNCNRATPSCRKKASGLGAPICLSEAPHTLSCMSKRKNPPLPVVVSVWAKSAGRCCMCGEPQLVSSLTDVTVTIGEVAHQAGATEGEKSPRSDAAVPFTDRDKEENLMLLCHGCHRKIDSAVGQQIYTVEVLRGIKEQHEGMVAAVTDFRTENRTLVIATRSTVRGQAVGASQREIAFALVESRRAPHSVGNLTYRVDIDLTDQVSEDWVWQRGMRQIDAAAARIGTDVADGRVDHLSVFALAPIPLLVYLGHKLGDKWTVDVFRRTRDNTERSWCWGETEVHAPTFVHELPDAPRATEVVVAVEVTAPVKPQRLPAPVADLPVIRIRPEFVAPGPDLLGSRIAVDSFAKGWRSLLAQLEREMPGVKRLHVAAAVPTTAAVAIGRFHRPYVDPALVLYELAEDHTYTDALEIGA
ncbi:MAG: SAVED domain-containing protein [Actinobacteria bacterium]|nr:SAVED domain-containing protein [Actinomycetota bacterium]